MTLNEFAALCAQYGIAPEVALESDELRAALAAKDRDAVDRILREDF